MWWKYLCISSYIRTPSSSLTLHPIPSEFPNIWGKFCFLFIGVYYFYLNCKLLCLMIPCHSQTWSDDRWWFWSRRDGSRTDPCFLQKYKKYKNIVQFNHSTSSRNRDFNAGLMKTCVSPREKINIFVNFNKGPSSRTSGHIATKRFHRITFYVV